MRPHLRRRGSSSRLVSSCSARGRPTTSAAWVRRPERLSPRGSRTAPHSLPTACKKPSRRGTPDHRAVLHRRAQGRSSRRSAVRGRSCLRCPNGSAGRTNGPRSPANSPADHPAPLPSTRPAVRRAGGAGRDVRTDGSARGPPDISRDGQPQEPGRRARRPRTRTGWDACPQPRTRESAPPDASGLFEDVVDDPSRNGFGNGVAVDVVDERDQCLPQCPAATSAQTRFSAAERAPSPCG